MKVRNLPGGYTEGRVLLALVAALAVQLWAAPAHAARPAYPLKTSANGRYLVDQNNVPFLMTGDSPQALIGNLSGSDAEMYFANREAHGFNTVWINLLCNSYTACNADGTTYDGIPPFTVPEDLSWPNEGYFARADAMIHLAADHGLLVLLDPIETGGWLNILAANGPDKARAYGQYVGNRYKDFDNIVWLSGNDFQEWQNARFDEVVQAVALGIKNTDPRHIHTVELNYLASGSLDDAGWAPIIGLDAAYTYYPTYAQVLNEYNRSIFMPVFMIEANYEFEHNFEDEGTSETLRRQEYWTMLSGATGQLYGSVYTWRFTYGWNTNLDTPGAIQFGYLKSLFESRRWYDLIPDQNHTVVTSGYGTFSSTGTVIANDYVTTARTPDGRLVIAYLPTARTITADMSKLAGPATAQWFDPSNGLFAPIGGSPFANAGTHQFAPPGTNSGGNSDWVLVLNFDDFSFPPPITVPKTKAECKDGGWQHRARADGSSFRNQGACVSYVNTGK